MVNMESQKKLLRVCCSSNVSTLQGFNPVSFRTNLRFKACVPWQEWLYQCGCPRVVPKILLVYQTRNEPKKLMDT